MLSYADNILDSIYLYLETNDGRYLNKALDVTLKVLPNANGIIINEIDESLVTAIRALNKKNKGKYLSHIETYLLTYDDVLGETDSGFDSAELWSAYNKILSGFSDRDKRIINLYFIYQMTTREIEAVSSISRGMVSVITKKFINNMKKELLNI